MEISFSGTYSLHYYQYIQTSSGLYNAFFRYLKTLELAQFHHLDTMVLQMQWQLFLSEAEIHFFNPRVNSTQFCSKWSKETLVRILSLILNLSVRYHSLKKKNLPQNFYLQMVVMGLSLKSRSSSSILHMLTESPCRHLHKCYLCVLRLLPVFCLAIFYDFQIWLL